MCTDDKNSSTTNIAIFILLAVVIILLILVMAIAITLCVRRKKRKTQCQVQLDHEEHINDMPHFQLNSSKSATKHDDEKPNVAYGKASISGTECDDVKYVCQM